MTKSATFKSAHAQARVTKFIFGSYRAAFADALRQSATVCRTLAANLPGYQHVPCDVSGLRPAIGAWR